MGITSEPGETNETAKSANGGDCELCEAARLTEWYHEDDICWIAECEACWVPMVVWRDHGIVPPGEAVSHMHAALAAVGDKLFGVDEWFLDDNMRQIPEHYHAHARKKLPWMKK